MTNIKSIGKSATFWAFIIVMATMAVRINWMGKGVYGFPDETRYEASQILVTEFLKGNFINAFSSLVKTDARPVDCLLHAFPALIQIISQHTEGINHPDSLIWVQYFHVLLFGILALVFYWLSTLLFPQREIYALFALCCFVLIVNNHVHARHILPYDLALFLFLFAFSLIVNTHIKTNTVSIRIKFLAGSISALAWLTYPGYYWLPVLMLGYMILQNKSYNVNGIFSVAWPFLLGGFLIFFPFEIIYWYYENSLLYGLAGLSLGINQGDYHESLEFMVNYMKETNGFLGWIMSMTFLIVGVYCLVKVFFDSFDPLKACLGLAFGAWLFHMALGEILEFMVFYGRLIHAFVPFMIWALIAVCIRLNWLSIPALLMIIFLGLLSFLDFNKEYQIIAYPRDVLYSFSSYKPSPSTVPVLELTKNKKEKDAYCNIHEPYAYYVIRDRKVDARLNFYNTAILYPIEGQEFIECKNKAQQLLLDQPYYLSFVPYGYEGYSPTARKLLKSGLYRTQVQVRK